MSAPVPQPIAVNFNVVIDASGNLEVFNAAAPVVGNVIVAEHTLLTTALYDPTEGALIELWEPENAQGDIKAQLANSDYSVSGGGDFVGFYQTAAKRLAAGLEKILCDRFDCSGAAPFSAYTSNVEYYKQRDFGRVALATYAHHLFGHVDATAAITNDKAFVHSMLSCSAAGDDESAGGAAARYAAWTKSTAANIQAWNIASSSSDANLALRLIHALVSKGLDGAGATTISSVNQGDTASIANIVSQVVGQDASRLMNIDNSQRTREQHALLRFYAGDVIYMNVTLKTPNVNIGSTNQLVSKAALEAMYPSSSNNFTIKITLEAPPPPPVGGFTYSDATNTVVTGYTGTPAGGALIIPAGVTSIAQNAFAARSDITSVVFPTSVTSIGIAAFQSCSALTTVTMASGLTYIGVAAFQYSGVTSIVFPNTLTEIADAAFQSCSALTSIRFLSNNVTLYGNSFGYSAFATVTMPVGATMDPVYFRLAVPIVYV